MWRVEDSSHWTLIWEEAQPFNNTLPNIDLTKGIICHIPSEQATYCFHPSGECWRFTQDAAVGLTYEE